MSYANPTSPDDYIDALNWGTATGAETTSTLYNDVKDYKIPPSQYHTPALKITRMAQLLLLISQYAKGGNRWRIIPNSSNQFSVGESGYQFSSTSPQVPQSVYNGGTPHNLQTQLQQVVTFSATPTFDPASGSLITITLTGNITSWGISAGYSGQQISIEFIQDGTGSRTLAAPPAAVTVAGGSLTLTTTANKVDVVSFRYSTSTGKWRETSRALNQ